MPKRDVVEELCAPDVGSRIIWILSAFALVSINDAVPVSVLYIGVLDRILLALTVDRNCVIFSRVVVDQTARVALTVVLIT